MNKGIILKSIVVLVIIALLLSPLGPDGPMAGWVDDWLQQKTETSPGYFEGQKRGYFTGGSFSAR